MKTKGSNKELITIIVPRGFNDVLKIQSLVLNTKKSVMLRSILQRHADDNGWDLESSIDKYVQQLFSQWLHRYSETEDFDAYLLNVESKLNTKHGLNPSIINTILRKCKEQLEKHYQNK